MRRWCRWRDINLHFHRRLPRHRRGQQPAGGAPRQPHPPGQRPRAGRPAHFVAARGGHERPRALREIVCSLGGIGNGFPRSDGFDITVASEVMAIFCLATDLKDLQRRLGNIVVGQTRAREPVTARDSQGRRRDDRAAQGRARPEPGADPGKQPRHHPRRAVREHRPRLQLGHRHQSVAQARGLRRHRSRLRADLGAEKFFDIKCRKAGIAPDAVVLVATLRALKMHGGVVLADLGREDVAAVRAGCANLARHLANLKQFCSSGGRRGEPVLGRHASGASGRRRCRRRAGRECDRLLPFGRTAGRGPTPSLATWWR